MQSKIRDLKLLFIVDSLNAGGAQRQMVNLALGLTRRGYQIQFFCYSPGHQLAQPLHDAGVKIHWFYKRSRYSPNVIFALKNLVDHGNYDLILSFLPTPNFYAILVGRLLSRLRVPVIVSERSSDQFPGVSQVLRFSQQFFRLATYIVTNSHHQRITLSNRFPQLRERISTIYNGLDLQVFSPLATEPDNHPIKLLVIASVAPYKNGLCLVEALKILKKRNGLFPQVDWIGRHATQGKLLEYLNKMKHMISTYGLEQQWQWMGLRSDIVDQLQHHDVFIHPSYIEGLPNVVCEAIACGRPVIVSNTLDHSNLVQHGDNGYLFDYQNPEDLADKVKMFIDLPVSKRHKMGEKSRQIAVERLSQERLVDDYEALFLRLVNL